MDGFIVVGKSKVISVCSYRNLFELRCLRCTIHFSDWPRFKLIKQLVIIIVLLDFAVIKGELFMSIKHLL